MTRPDVSRFSEVRLICTDKGRHPSRELLFVTVRDDPELWDMLAESLGQDTEAFRAFYLYETVHLGRNTMPKSGRNVTHRAEFRDDVENPAVIIPPCPSCGRESRFTLARLDALTRAAWYSGLPRVDLSRMA